MNEYRISAPIAESGMSWEAYKAKFGPAQKLREYRPPRAPARRTPAPGAMEVAPESAVVEVAATPCVAPVPAGSPLFTIGSDMRLRLSVDGVDIALSAEDTVTLGRLMVGSAEIWFQERRQQP
jgi:hypothetical protein